MDKLTSKSFAEFFSEYSTVKVVWEYIGEGLFGEFDPFDSMDEPLLRFTCYRKDPSVAGGWGVIEGSSFCSRFVLGQTEEKVLEDFTYSQIFPALETSNYISILEDITYDDPVIT